MLLSELLNNIEAIQTVDINSPVEIKKITLDSRDAISGSIFVAIKGFKLNGHDFIEQAVSNGVSAIVLEDANNDIDQLLRNNNVVKILVKDSRKALPKLSKTLYNEPSEKLNLIGITGTKGKTTTSYFIKNILDRAGHLSGVIGTNKNMIGNVKVPTKLTTPESHVLNDLMSQMVEQKCTDCVMEVSSHSLELSRVDELDFNVGVFTNITSDHLDFHSTFENYLSAKKIFFDQLKSDATVIYNKDDENYTALLTNCSANKISYSLNGEADLEISKVEYDLDGTSFKLSYDNNTYDVHTKLIGLFNAYNSVAAFGATIISGIEINKAIEGIKSTPQVPGRFEVISKSNKKVIIDYSHTSGSLEEALKAIKHIVKEERKITTVFGCGGDRDKTKRPTMGSVAESLSDLVYVTSDNPRTEEPLEIIKDIEAGMKLRKHIVIENRADAIKKAISASDENAVILIAGKGHETYQEINGVRNYFSDKDEALKHI